MTLAVPTTHTDLLEKPTFAHLATVRPDGAPQSSVMWFVWDGQRLRFTHTRTRQKFKNIAHERRVTVSIRDEANPYRFLEVRGEVESIETDPTATFYKALQRRYGVDYPVFDAEVRVVITVRPTHFVAVDRGMTDKERAALQRQLAGANR
jgi:PPOX class probable F420-dependent enzyme